MLNLANTFYVPEYRDYLETVESLKYREMRAFSDAFIHRYGDLYAQYSLWWVKDPLRAWSRAWEYEFVFQALEGVVRSENNTLKILDAGSGFTFFPFYVVDKISTAEVLCCDFDSRLGDLFVRVGSSEVRKPTFQLGNLEALGFSEDSFDCVVCISVLEHLDERIAAFREMMRVVRPGGKVVLTMDYSRDGRADITMPKLLEFLEAVFSENGVGCEGKLNSFIQAMSGDESLLTTRHFLSSRDQLPWKYPVLSSVISSIKKGKVPRFGVKDIGVVGLVCQKAG